MQYPFPPKRKIGKVQYWLDLLFPEDRHAVNKPVEGLPPLNLHWSTWPPVNVRKATSFP